MKEGRTGHNLFLLEMIFVVLFFALGAAICAKVFAASYSMEQEAAHLSRAVFFAQEAGETFRSCGGDLEKAASLLSGRASGSSLSAVREDLSLSLTRRREENLVLGDIVIEKDGRALYTLTASLALGKEALP